MWLSAFLGGHPILILSDALWIGLSITEASSRHLDETLVLLRRIDKDAEVSMEADPGTFDSTRLSEYQSLGVNRFSIGVQAFQEVRPKCWPSLSSNDTGPSLFSATSPAAD